MLDLWIRQATGLSMWQVWFLLGLCIFLIALVASIKDEKEVD